MPLKVGITLPQELERDRIDPIEAYETMTQVAQEAEYLELASVWLADHLHSPAYGRPAETMIFESWTSTAALARDTSRIRIGQVVTCNGFRNPALLAKMASTVDVLSHGRLDLGIGAGWYEQEFLGYGYPFPKASVRLAQLGEALQIIKAMWTQEEVHFAGKYYTLHGAINQPKGVQKPHIPILVAGKGEQITLKIVARYADACNFTHPTLEEFRHKSTLLKHYCEDIGRDDREIRRTIYINGFLGETEVEATAKVNRLGGRFTIDHVRQRGLLGTPAQVRHRLKELEQAGVQEVIVVLRDSTQSNSLQLLAEASSGN
jgi:F420-dependent oxidoreductase-like protein